MRIRELEDSLLRDGLHPKLGESGAQYIYSLAKKSSSTSPFCLKVTINVESNGRHFASTLV
jgi:hypothetical protein